MTARNLALFLHLVGVLALVAGVASAAVAHRQARRADRAADVAVLLRMARAGVLVAAPGTLLLLAAGVWLIHLERLGLHVRWLRDAIGLFVLAAVLGGTGGRRPRQARELAEAVRDSDAAARVDDRLRRLLDDRVSMLANAASSLAMLGVLWLMVTKPA